MDISILAYSQAPIWCPLILPGLIPQKFQKQAVYAGCKSRSKSQRISRKMFTGTKLQRWHHRMSDFGLPVGLGDPVFEKLDANLAKAILSIGAVKGFEIGAGFGAATATGLTNNDAFCMENGHISKRTNYSGGTLGGMSDGSLLFSVQPSNRHRPLEQHSRPSTKTEKKLRSASKDDTIRLSFRVQWSLLRQ